MIEVDGESGSSDSEVVVPMAMVKVQMVILIAEYDAGGIVVVG